MGHPQYAVEFSQNAVEDLQSFHKSGQHTIIKKIKQLIDSIKEDPVRGIGKPELLKHGLAGHYSRRINQEHRMIYKVVDNVVYINSMRGHYH